MKKKKTYSVERTRIDTQTGEVLHVEEMQKYLLMDDNDTFTIIYHDNLLALLKEAKFSNAILFFKIMQLIEYNTNYIYLNAERKKEAVAGFNVRTFNNAMLDYCKIGILHKVALGTYLVNPYIAWRGSLKDRLFAIKKGKFDCFNK